MLRAGLQPAVGGYKSPLSGDGYAIEWPDLDEHIGIEGLLAGRRSSEGQTSLARWLAGRRDA